MSGINTNYYSSINAAYMGYSSGIGSFTSSGVSGLADSLSKLGQNLSTTSSSMKSFLTDVKRFSEKLGAAAEKMVAGQPPVFSRMIATLGQSSDKSSRSVSVQVDQLATTQKNTGNTMNAEETVSRSGAQSFAIESGGKTTTVSANISATDNNRAAQQKIADAINKSGAGVTASVQYDSKTKQSSLIIEGKETGEDQNFSVKDLYGGQLASDYGMNNTERTAQDAVYSLDGKSATSATNTVDLGGGASVALTSTGATTVSLSKDTNAIKSVVSDFLDNFNSLMDTAQTHGSSSLSARLNNAYASSSVALSKAGIYMGIDGSLQMDEQLVEKSIADGSLEKALGLNETNKNLGFVGRVSNIAEEAENNPAVFSASNTGTSSGLYNSWDDSGYGTSFKQYAYDLMFSNIGQLFDYLM